MNGERRRFVGPVGYLFFSSAMLVLSMHYFDPDGIARLVRDTMGAGRGAGAPQLMSPKQLAVYTRIMQTISDESAWTNVAMALPVVVSVRYAFRKTGVNLAETAVLILYTFANLALLYAATVPLFVASGASGMLRVRVAMGAYVAATAWACIGYFGGGVRTAVRGALAYGVGYLLFGLTVAAVVLGYVMTRVPR